LVDAGNGGPVELFRVDAGERRSVGDIWSAALQGNQTPVQVDALYKLADRVRAAIGVIEGDPSQLAPPAPPSRSTWHQQLPPIHIHGDGNVFTFSGRDSVVKHIHTSAGHAELQKATDELKAALVELAEDDEDVKDRHHAVDRLKEHLTKDQPDAKPINRAWERVVGFATIEGVIQGGERIGRALQALWPYVEPWVEASPTVPPLLPGATT
jgi:hypothetical protein